MTGWESISLWGAEAQMIQSLQGLGTNTDLPCPVLVAGLSSQRESCCAVGKVVQGEVWSGKDKERERH